MAKIVVLLSGGVDSTTAAYRAHFEGHEVHALSILYGHKAKGEIKCAEKTAIAICASHKIVDMNFMKEIWHTPLTDMECLPEENDRQGNSYYIVPLRNIVFLSIAHAYAQSIGATEVWIGNHMDDCKGFPDCTPETMKLFDDMIWEASENGKCTSTVSPWQYTPKEQIVYQGLKLGVPYENTHSCYEDGIACGVCESCQYRQKAFEACGVKDPIPYATDTYNLCDTCAEGGYSPGCPSENVAFGSGLGNDNIIQCDGFKEG